MKKETIAAIFFGVLLGVIGAFIMISKAKQISSNKVMNENVKNTTATASSKLKNIKNLEVTSPTNQSLSSTNSLIVKGKVEKNSLIVIQSPVKEVVLKNNKESFETAFPLALGENLITITAYPKDTHISPQQKVLKVYYLDEK